IQFAGLLLVVFAGFFHSPDAAAVAELPVASERNGTALGLAMVFVLLTFGGWNEAGYISAELRSGSRNMVQVLIISILIITTICLLINGAFISVLGMDRVAASDAVGVDLMRVTLGEPGVFLIGMLVALAALTSVNATIFTGARTN